MENRKILTLELQKQAAAEAMWLNYYNTVLYEKGIITEQERNRMARKIAARISYRIAS